MTAPLLGLAGAVALLVWGAYMVKTGILRTFGDALRTQLAVHMKNRLLGFAAGFGLASLLQSSTASALLVAGLQSGGLVTTTLALSAVLGADLGSAVMVRVLTLDLSGAAPLLILAGTILFMRRPQERSGQFGRILLGLAFILTALSTIVGVTEPLRAGANGMSGADGSLVAGVFALLAGSAPLSAVAGVALALLFFSSLAVVAAAAAFSSAGLLPAEAGLWLVLGANFGSALLALLSTAGGSRTARRAPLGNFLFRTIGFAAGAAILALAPGLRERVAELPDGVILLHIAFNLAVGVIGLIFVRPAARLIDGWLPEKSDEPDEEVRLLAAENLLSAATALRLARAETAKTARILERHWESLRALIRANPPDGELLVIERRRKLIERRARAVSLCLAAVVRLGLSERESREWERLSTLCDALSLAADVTRRIGKAVRRGKLADGRFFSESGAQELEAVHGEVAESLRAFATLIELGEPGRGAPSGSKGTGRAESESAARSERTEQAERAERAAELRSTLLAGEEAREERFRARVLMHMNRVAAGAPESVETSALHLELLGLARRLSGVVANAAEAL